MSSVRVLVSVSVCHNAGSELYVTVSGSQTILNMSEDSKHPKSKNTYFPPNPLWYLANELVLVQHEGVFTGLEIFVLVLTFHFSVQFS